MPKSFDQLAQLALKKQELMLKQMQKRQQTYFTYQQNKFMRTTNIEGGMKDAGSGESIR